MVHQTSRGALVFNYSSVMPGRPSELSNRSVFLDAIFNIQAPGELLIFGGGQWYDVTDLTLVEAFRQSKFGSPAEAYQFVLDNGAEVSAAAAGLIDSINASYPLNSLAAVQPLYDRYQALSAAERALLANEYAIQDLLEAYADLS